ncbi:hypothetical protein LU699_13250 [Luteimonas fraxinea]|uniref:Lipoprotein n=1 Tax=Luteimonas fraxinea TaxID=2901869 RepID=A0ABS8UEU0_9GAMM|nr:hypothetical protein [Luteimonas fraxinea]MCD9098018.1 hypothetical protein [Luteimonas fraxinea]UHH09254.1 hypothetical protein LU699_13250 [Luteimonas fraxinea]
MKMFLIPLCAIALVACNGEEPASSPPTETPTAAAPVAPASPVAAPADGTPQSYGNDMLPSAEVIAFESADKQHGYTDARIEWDENNCAVYEGVAPNGERARHPLVAQDNQPICSR